MGKLTIYLLVLVVLCQSIAVFSRQVDLDFFDNQSGNNGVQPQQPPQTSGGTTTTTPSPTFTRCITDCNSQVTAQYNPVCGSNGQSYPNPNRLECARRCGLNVSVSHVGTCGPSAGGK